MPMEANLTIKIIKFIELDNDSDNDSDNESENHLENESEENELENKLENKLGNEEENIGYEYIFQFTFGVNSNIMFSYDTMIANLIIDGNVIELANRNLNDMIDYCMNYITANNAKDLEFTEINKHEYKPKEFYITLNSSFLIS